MFACNIVVIPPNFRTGIYHFPGKTTFFSFSELRTSLDHQLFHCLPILCQRNNKDTEMTKAKKILIIIVNNEPRKKGTTMQKSWLEPTCCPKISWIIVTHVFILSLTFTYVITYFLIPFDWLQLLPTFQIQKTLYLQWLKVTKRIGSPLSGDSKWVQDQQH